jgi:hydroxymethylpyrimidine pyrophosphatase-like HAD family hydrolase
VEKLKKQLGLTHVICFGDGDNDLSMFNIADESYAMSNSSGIIKESATATIGHHDEDGVAYFLKDRFNLK